MTIGLATAVRSARVTQVLNAMDAGSGPAKIRLYNGTRPATGGAPTTLLAELTCSDPSGTVTDGVFTLSAITADSSANASGTVTWFRIVDSADVFVLDGYVTTVGGGGDVTMNSTAVTAGTPVNGISFVITDNNA